MKADPERDFICLGEDFYVGFLYGGLADESEFLRSFRSVWLEIKFDNVEEPTWKILDFGVRKRHRTLTFTSRLQEVNASG